MTRKPISYPRLIWRLRLAWLAIPILVGLGFSVASVRVFLTHQALERDGILGETVVIARDTIKLPGREGRLSDIVFYVTHSFRPDGHTETITARESVGGRFYRRVGDGDTLPVTYLPSRPALNSIYPTQSAR